MAAYNAVRGLFGISCFTRWTGHQPRAGDSARICGVLDPCAPRSGPSFGMEELHRRAVALLDSHFGFPAFRSLQWRVVRSVLERYDTLGVLPTGGGKSICFQIPALALGGWTLVVSPLIALIEDQVAAARRRGIGAASLAGPLGRATVGAALEAAGSGRVPLLYTSPERLSTLVAALGVGGTLPRLIAVDEAHCISEWGHDFRPAFRAIGRARGLLGNPPVVALTGSATPRVRDDIASVLNLGGTGHPETRVVASFDRPNLWFEVRKVADEFARFHALLALLDARESLAIVYAPTRRRAEGIAAALRRAGRRALAYHAGFTAADRSQRLSRFLSDDLGVVVATSAFGMGIDKPDVRSVVHWSLPATPESYYQEAGRAGRDGQPARCTLLYRRGDADVHHRQLDVTFPSRKLLESSWSGDVPPARLPAAVRASIERLRQELRPDDGPVDWNRIEVRRREAGRRIGAVESYARGSGCRRAALLTYFGDRIARCAGCGGCGRKPGR